MTELQTMPLRFRVWDKNQKQLVRWMGVDDFDLWILADWMDTILVNEFYDDFIISQDTGLKDKNGKSIFTGDIVELTEKRDTGFGSKSITKTIAPVVFQDSQVKLEINRPGYMGGAYWVLLYMHQSEEIEVVGNIWQNKELLEENNEG